MKLKVFTSTEELTETVAHAIIEAAKAAIALKGSFNLVLTGGNSPKALHGLLANQYASAINWQNVYFFIGDERNVPATSKEYNGLMALETLLQPLGIPSENIFLVNTHLSPEVAAAQYYAQIKNHFKQSPIVFDYILLGMGEDAHTASIFPDTTIIDNQSATVEAVFVAKLDAWRISFTAKLINQAKEIGFLVFGKGKAAALAAVLQGEKNTRKYPAQLITGNATIYADTEAAALLKDVH